MSTDLTYPHIERIEGGPARLQRLPRIRVTQVVIDYLNHGWSADEICIHYPHLKQAEVHSALAYYFDHQAEIDGEIEEEQRQIEAARRQAGPTAVALRLRRPGPLAASLNLSKLRVSSMPIRLYLDVHVDKAIHDQLRLRGVDVLRAQDDDAARMTDEELLQRATELGRTVFTQDIRFKALAEEWQRQNRTFSGFLFGSQLGVTVGTYVKNLELIARATDPGDWVNVIQHLPYR